MPGTRAFRKNDIVEIDRDINCIPKGVYRFQEQLGQLLWFRIKRRVMFAVSIEGIQSMKRLSTKEAFGRLTKYPDFEKRYYNLAAENAIKEPREGEATSVAIFACASNQEIDTHHAKTLGFLGKLN